MKELVPRIRESMPKEQIVEMMRAHLEKQGFTIAELDRTRPWGAFLRVVNTQADQFIATYFDKAAVPAHARRGERSPKILLVAPHQRLSWQYHDRRGELWRDVEGRSGVYLSKTDEQPKEMRVLEPGDTLEIPQGTRHRLVGLEGWGAVAEIWMHTDPQHPSEESDNHRLQDDYDRET